MTSLGLIKLELSLTSLFYPREKKRETRPLLIDLMHQSQYKDKLAALFLFLLLLIRTYFEYIYHKFSYKPQTFWHCFH